MFFPIKLTESFISASRMKRSVNILAGGVIKAAEVVKILRTDDNMHSDFEIVSIQPLCIPFNSSLKNLKFRLQADLFKPRLL